MEDSDETEIEVGDLVCLADDDDYMVGIGIVLDTATDTEAHINDYLLPMYYGEIHDDDKEEKLFLQRPVYLVLWTGDKNFFYEDLTSSPRPLWFFKNELKVVNKADRKK